LNVRFGIFHFHPAPSTAYPAWIHNRTQTYINLVKGEADNQVDIHFDGRIEGSFRLPMYLESDGREWGVLPEHLATVNGEDIVFRVEQLAERRLKGLYCPTDWYCRTKRQNPKGNQLLPYTKLTTPAGILYAQKIRGWRAYLPNQFDAATGDPFDVNADPTLIDTSLDGIKAQLYDLFVEGKMRDIAELVV
jgi:hypothetical protein